MPREEQNMDALSLVARFKEKWLLAAGEYISVHESDELVELLKQYLNSEKINRIVLGGSPLTEAVGKALLNQFDVLADFSNYEYDQETAKTLCSRAEAGITGVDALIADTGTLVVASRGRGDRMCSSLPPVHIVVAADAPYFADLDTFLKIMPVDLTFTLITGPSRTADIEKQLVLGAHGPVRVIVFGQ